MSMRRGALRAIVLAALLVGADARAQLQGLGERGAVIEPEDDIFTPRLGRGDPPEADPPVPPPLPPPPGDPAEWEQALKGRPVYGFQSGRIGEVVSLAANPDGSPASAVVRLDPAIDPARGWLPVPWTWVRGQMDNPTLVVPWSAAQVAWFVRR